ncbi:eukaryotic-type carbonic anhydrase family protein [Listeria floridensis FSL S10-1187]|uniref:Carbonic anhydrase n=1 Tax=Listeria floridensis FSL S10-1187 TaxID=1265817 RepID=A0ABN0RFT3_9LIST|nr:carbonic anhydrase family protein [Listeria floridensis]EUJ32278.1 eukaryotic-type carbonic anhydrase family protein [Listeria floridensis FSL S10-1187]
MEAVLKNRVIVKRIKQKQKKEAKSESHLNYDDQKGWAFESGDSQSPINIEPAKTEAMKDTGKLELNYSDTVVDEVDNGHAVQVDDTGSAVINGRSFELTQFHFHAKSEHTVDGKHYPIEVHFVNQAQDGRLAVVGVFFKEGAENPGFQTVLDNIKKGEKVEVSSKIDVAKMLPTNLSYYHYLGSLTTPPLSENVEWYVMKNPVEVSKAQIEAFEKYYDANNRDTQPLNDRKVLEHQE